VEVLNILLLYFIQQDLRSLNILLGPCVRATSWLSACVPLNTLLCGCTRVNTCQQTHVRNSKISHDISLYIYKSLNGKEGNKNGHFACSAASYGEWSSGTRTGLELHVAYLEKCTPCKVPIRFNTYVCHGAFFAESARCKTGHDHDLLTAPSLLSCLKGPIHDQSCCAKMFCAT
jgi:hypothetical protein